MACVGVAWTWKLVPPGSGSGPSLRTCSAARGDVLGETTFEGYLMSIFASVNALMNRYTTLSNAQATNIYNVWNAVINNWDQLVLHDPDIQAALQTANTMASHTDQNQDITRMQAQGIPLNTRDISVTRAQGDHVKKLYAILLAFRSC